MLIWRFVMAIGERIRTFRKRKGLTQKELGVQLGFKESTADIRMAQYEAEKRVPKDDLIETFFHFGSFSCGH